MPKLVSTGQITLTDVTDGLYARLSSESHVVPTNTDGSDGTYDGCSTTMSILLGRTDDSANWSVTASATAGVIGELVGKTYTVSNMTVDAGYVDITATRVGYPALTSRFSITKARRGFAGPAITLIASKQGFSFVDGIAEPADQSIAFTVVRHNATEPVVFYATGDASLVSDDGRLTLMNYALGVPGVGNGDTAYLDLAQFGNNRQVTITAVCGDLNATQTVVRLDQSSAAAGATRNVHRGNWTSNTPYQLGDTVIYQGYGWSCTTAHTSSVVVTPPVYPVGFNDNWTLASVKGADSKSAYLTSSSYVFRIAQDGTVSPSSIALTAVGQNITGEPTFEVQTGTATLSGSSGVARTLTAANLTSEQATIKITWDGLEDFVTVTKIREGSNGITVVSSNEAHVLPADKDGAVTSYTNSGTTIQVFEGSVALNASSSATVSAFRVGTITQSPSSTITVGAVSYAGTTATIPNHSAMANGTDSVVLTIPVTVYRADGSSIVVNKIQTISKSKTGATGATGTDALTIVVSNEAHTLPASNTGVVSSYTNSGTTIQVFEGVTALNAVSSIAANSQFTIGTPVLSPAASITVGNRTYSSTTATVAQHSMMLDATDSILITYPVSIRRSNGANVTINCSQTITKSKAGAQGTQGIQGVKGNDGITYYTWVKYADSPTTGMSDFPDGKLYLGVAYNKTTAVESTTYADYSWSLIKGSDGVQGPKGDDGVTTYTWIKYADTSAGVGMSDSPTGKTYIGIAPNKTSPTESTTAGDYTWSLIQGPKGDQGPAVVVNSSRALSFTATDGTLDGSQLDIVLTASVSGVASPTYAWAFSGLQTDPTASVTNSQTITAAQFGTSKSAIVTCTVNGTYVDKVTIVRLEKSTAAPYATTGSNLAAPFDSWNLLGQSLATITDGKVGSTSLRLTSAAGACPIQRNFIPIDPTKKYRAKFWARPSADCNGSLYFNLRQAITTAPSWGPTNGGRHPYQPSAITRAAHNSTFGGTDQWGEYSYIWDSTHWQTGVKFFVPEFLNNYQGSTGYWEIQDVVVEEVTAVEAAKTLAIAAADAAAEAQLDADAANAMLTDIASDSKLTPVEKKQVKLEWDSLVAEKAGINTQATLFGITTENTSYNNNYTTLSSYLSSLLSDLSTPSTIVGSAFRLNFTNFYSARQELLNKISVEASKRADWELVTGANKPENGATVGAPAGTLVAGVPAANVATAVTDFNASNNRNNAAITAPTIITDGTAVYHVAQTDGSVDIRFEWGWSGNEGDIDGFLVYVRPSTSSTAYTLGTTPAEETVYTVPANKRAFVLFGVAADKYYTFGVQAYRAVDKAINAAGVIKSTLVKATGSGENPYRPSSTVAFTGDVTGTISGTSASTLVSTASTALSNANAAQTDATKALNDLTDIASDSKLTPAEKKSVRKEWDAAYAEYAGIITQATAFGVTTEKTSYDNAIKALGTYLNNAVTYTLGTTPPSWITDANLVTTTTIVGATFRTNWATLYQHRQELLNKISAEAAKRADWSTITGSGKPENGATKNTIYRQSTTPSGGTNGDIWVDTSITPNVQKILVGGTWQISSTVGASFDNTSPSAIQGQITSSNVSVWIGAAAIGAAQIGSIQLIGNFNVKSAVSGERMEMDSQSIKVYDSTRLRVQLGNLDV